MSTQGFSLKDQLFNSEKTAYLAGLFVPHAADFDAGSFEADVVTRLPDLELKERISWIAEMLEHHIPGGLEEIAPILRAALPPPLDPDLSDDDFGDFIIAPLGEWVVSLAFPDDTKGAARIDLGLDLLEDLTQRFSMEWAIRPFLLRAPEATLERMKRWAEDENYHIRRLATEGSRPRLPWGLAVNLPLDAPMPILDRLHADKTRYVTRSVANHLNDISKKDPAMVVEKLSEWRDLRRQNDKELGWITTHALRGLVKAGHPGAMKLMGYDPELEVTVTLTLPDEVRINDKLALSCHLSGPANVGVLVDYRMSFQRPGGKISKKVFKLKQAKLGPDGLHLSKYHGLKGGASTFTLVPGAHEVEILVNGVVRASGQFQLLSA